VLKQGADVGAAATALLAPTARRASTFFKDRILSKIERPRDRRPKPIRLAAAGLSRVLRPAARMTRCIAGLLHTDRRRRKDPLAAGRSRDHHWLEEKVAHIGHWLVEYPAGTVEWSEEYYRICGLPRDTRPNIETALALHHPDDFAAAHEIARATRDGRGWEVALRICRPGGEVRSIVSRGVCEHDAEGDVTAIFGVFADVTELESARREAATATAVRAAFLVSMNHEIRLAMKGVMESVDLIMDGTPDAKQRRHLPLVQETVPALLRLLNEILDSSRIEAGVLELSAESSSIRHDITQCIRLMAATAERKNLALSVAFAEDFPASVLIDSLRLRQILLNLVGNAIGFTARGSVAVTLDETRGPRGRRLIAITIADTGVGIGDERKAAIFDDCEQVDESASRRRGGSGPGLGMSRRLARLMGGTIALDSRKNSGTIITLTLPLDELVAPPFVGIAAAERPDAAMVAPPAPIRRQAAALPVADINPEPIAA
jgi:signal transduction histidine kinase